MCDPLPSVPHLTWILNGSLANTTFSVQYKKYTNQNTYMSTIEALCDDTHYLSDASLSPFYCTYDGVWSVNVTEFTCLCKYVVLVHGIRIISSMEKRSTVDVL